MPAPGDPRDDLVAAILDAPARLGRIRLVAVDGPSGSGKTTLAGRLQAALAAVGVAVATVSTDHFATWDDPFDWWPRLERDVLTPLAAGRTAVYAAMDWSDGTPVARRPVTVPPVEVLLLEGVSSARRAVTGRLSLAVWVEVRDRAERAGRAITRDGEVIREPLRRWQDDEDRWFAADGTKDRADVRRPTTAAGSADG